MPQARTVGRGLAVLGAGIGTALLALAVLLAVNLARGNFHEVLKGELYRSAQPDARMLSWAKDTYGVRSVLNLRGAHPGSDWYDAEVSAAGDLGLVHKDFAMSASRQFGPDDAARVTTLMAALPKPLLVHCLSGSDRSGLASALYLGRIAGYPADIAGRQLSIRFGHIAIPRLSAAYPMDESWARLSPP
jgi:protein tyrosine/serine phosphatase